MVIEAIAAEKAAEEAVARRAVEVEAIKKAAEELVGSNPSLAPEAGTNRAAMLGSSTPPAKWFHDAWRHQYVE
jgi:hypothetical protein